MQNYKETNLNFMNILSGPTVIVLPGNAFAFYSMRLCSCPILDAVKLPSISKIQFVYFS